MRFRDWEQLEGKVLHIKIESVWKGHDGTPHLRFEVLEESEYINGSPASLDED